METSDPSVLQIQLIDLMFDIGKMCIKFKSIVLLRENEQDI